MGSTGCSGIIYKGRKTMQQQQGGFWRRLGRIWVPFLIKIGISYLVSFIVTIGLMYVYLVTQSGNDAEVMMSMLESDASVQEISNAIALEADNYSTYIEGISAALTIPVMLFMFHRDRIREKLHGIAAAVKAPLRQYWTILLMAAALCIGLNNLFLLSGLSTQDEAYVESMEQMYSPSLFMQLLCLGILTPLSEELVYRALVYKRMREQSGFLASAIYSTLVFAILHVYFVQIIYAFIMGMIFCYLYEKFGSIRAPAAAHMAANIVSILGTQFAWFDWMLAEPARVILITIACAAIASSMYVLMERMIDNEEPLPEIPEQNENGSDT